MAKRTKTTTREQAGSTADSMEQRMLAFAEQIGRIAGTMQAKAEGWLDRDALNTQIASIRDGATDMLKQLGATTRAAAASATAAENARPARSNSQGRQAKAASKRTTAAGPKRQGGGKQPATKRARAAGARTEGGGSRKSEAAPRSGGRVDAPGKKHRGPMPDEGGATGRPRGDGERLAKLKAANMTRVQRRG